MAGHTAHLVDHVFPPVAVRQWVLSLPHRVRYLLAWDHDLCRAVVAIFLRTVQGFLRTRARQGGLADGRSGSVAIVQRFGAALNLNIHVHALVLDGVFARDGSGRVAFHEATPPSDDDVAAVVDTIRQRVLRLLERRGQGVDDDGFAPDRWVEEAPVLAGMGAASVQGRVTSGPRAPAMVRRLQDSPDDVDVGTPRGNCHARREGFDLHAGVVAPAGHRHRLEGLCRYGLRPPIAEERLQVTPAEQVMLRLRHRWTDGTTHLLFDPLELLERLAVITPRPRINLILYHGVLAPRAAWRRQIVQNPNMRVSGVNYTHVSESGAAAMDNCGNPTPRSDPPARSWASLMRRVFGYDVLSCPHCGQTMRLIALIEQADVIRRILRHLGLPTEVPEPAPARAPPRVYDPDDIGGGVLRGIDPVSRRMLEPAIDDPY